MSRTKREDTMSPEEWAAENAALREQIRKAREARNATREELGWLAKCSEGLIRGIEEDETFITHPRIAARILAECSITDREMLKHLTPQCRWSRLAKKIRKPSPDKKLVQLWAEKEAAKTATHDTEVEHWLEKLELEVYDRRFEFKDFWLKWGYGYTKDGIKVMPEAIQAMVDAKNWGDDAYWRMGWRKADGYPKMLSRAQTSKDRVEQVVAALDCEMEDVVDLSDRIQQRFGDRYDRPNREMLKEWEAVRSAFTKQTGIGSR